MDSNEFYEQIWKENSDINKRFNGLDLEEVFAFLDKQADQADEELNGKQEQILEMVDFLSRYQIVVNTKSDQMAI